jgi:hypothetical protein
LRQYLAADKHQFMAKIIRERRLVIRMSGPLLAEAAGVAKGRAAAGQARKVLVDFAKQRAAEPNRVVASLNNSREQLENGTSLQARDTAAAFRKEQAASRDVNASWQFPLATPTFATIN